VLGLLEAATTPMRNVLTTFVQVSYNMLASKAVPCRLYVALANRSGWVSGEVIPVASSSSITAS
jgi:hypothetical protein